MPDTEIPVSDATPLSPAETANINNAVTTPVFFENDGTASTTSTGPVYYENDGAPSYSIPGGPVPGVVVGDIQNFSGIQTTSGQQQVDNPLHNYQDYTYCVSLHLLSPEDFNNLSENPFAGYVPKNVLISSAGRWGVGFPRNSNFTEDFFIDDLKLMTYVSPTSKNKNTNLVTCSFTIIEPLGFTLINRLLSAVTDQQGNIANYLQIPYMLQIDFFGSTDGDPSVPQGQMGLIKGMTKNIPIRIITMKSKLTAKGTEYQIEATPYNHQAFNKLNVSNPAACTISGSTVQELFGSGSFDATYGAQAAQRQILSAERAEITSFIAEVQTTGGQEGSSADLYRAQARLTQLNAQLETSISTKGFTNAINGWYQKLKDTKQIGEINTVSVEFDPLIANKKLYPSGFVNVAQTAPSGQTEKDKKTAIQSAVGQNKGQISFNDSVLTVPAGTTIDKLIDWAVRNSEYIGEQLSPANAFAVRAGGVPNSYGKPLKWYKIVPKVKLRKYDYITNNFAVDIIFYVKTYEMSTVYPFAPQGRVPGFVKRYDYIFTGKNKDVIDCQLDFDTLYYIPVTASKDKVAWAKTAAPLKNPGFNPNLDEITQRPQSFPAHPVTLGLISGSVQTTDRTGAATEKTVLAGDLQRSITLTARGDMINVNLKIIGDPHFIKQDDIFYAQNLTQAQNQFITNNSGSSLWFDKGELYVFLNFESPADYNEFTGVADPKTSKFRISEMTGVYKIIMVDSVFARGKFEQTLQLVKLLYDQEGKPLQTLNYDRADSRLSLNLGPLIPNQYSRFLGSRINLQPLVTDNVAAALLVTAATGGTSALSNLVQQGVNAVISKAVNTVSQQVGNYVGKALSDFGKNIFSTGTNAPGGATFGADIGFDNIDSIGYDAVTGPAGTVLQDNPADLYPEGFFDSMSTDVTDSLSGVTDFEINNIADLSLDFDVDFGSFLG